MPGNFRKDDLRIIKTFSALQDALYRLLGHRNFGRITVNDLCGEAQVSRTAFYFHFTDKYDLLKYWLNNIRTGLVYDSKTYSNMETIINDFIMDNVKVITNLLDDASKETIEILQEFVFSLLDITIEKDIDGKPNPKYIVLFCFCAGGMMNYLMWQRKNHFPIGIKVFNNYLYTLLNLLHEWDTYHD